MAATKEQQRRYQAALRRVLARFRVEQGELYRRWLEEALAEVDRDSSPEGLTKPEDRGLLNP